MSILFINGSPNKNGNTAKLAAELLKGHEYETLNLTDYTIGAYGQNLPGDGLDAVIGAMKQADIFVIIGTSLNVYPAAGLLNYVPRAAEVYLIDPKPVDTHVMRPIHVIQKGASEGVKELKALLTATQPPLP